MENSTSSIRTLSVISKLSDEGMSPLRRMAWLTDEAKLPAESWRAERLTDNVPTSRPAWRQMRSWSHACSSTH